MFQSTKRGIASGGVVGQKKDIVAALADYSLDAPSLEAIRWVSEGGDEPRSGVILVVVDKGQLSVHVGTGDGGHKQVAKRLGLDRSNLSGPVIEGAQFSIEPNGKVTVWSGSTTFGDITERTLGNSDRAVGPLADLIRRHLPRK